MIAFNAFNVYNTFSFTDWKTFNWIFDFETNVYITYIRFVFIKFNKIDKFYVIRDINDLCEIFIINTVLIFCNNIHKRIDLILKNISYVSECAINLIFQKQLNDVDYFMQILKKIVSLKINDIQVKKRNKNFYIFDVWSEQSIVFATINQNTEKKWHKRMKQLSKFNVRCL